MNKYRPLATLIETAEKLFHIPPGDLITAGRFQPVVSVRMLAILVAREAGASTMEVSRAFKLGVSSVKHASALARQHIKRERGWWMYGKADLFDAWQDALDD